MMQFVLLLLIGWTAEPHPVAPTEGETAAGLELTVLDQTRSAIVGAHVSIWDEGELRASASTDATGRAAFRLLEPGDYTATVRAPGFRTTDTHIVVPQDPPREIEVELPMAPRTERVDVQAKRVGLYRILTQTQIDALPDDPEAMWQALSELAGPGASIRVNGFRAERLPPKSQIREIRIQLNPYAAENHSSGLMGIDIRTKLGGASWRAEAALGLRPAVLSSRPALSAGSARSPQYRLSVAASGPVARDRSSLSLAAFARFRREPHVVVTPAFSLQGGSSTDSRFLSGTVTARFEQVLGASQTLRAEYEFHSDDRTNLGVGALDLPQRGYGRTQEEHTLRINHTGALGQSTVNDFRLQVRAATAGIVPQLREPVLEVPGVLRRGGPDLIGGRSSLEYEIGNDLDFTMLGGAWRTGVLAEVGRYRSDEQINPDGRFIFPDIDALNRGVPSLQFTPSGEARTSFWHTRVGMYLQARFLFAAGAAALNGGLRYELQSHVNKKANFAPRIHFVTAVPFDRETRLRLGWGVFYEWLNPIDYEQILRRNAEHQVAFTQGGEGETVPTFYALDPDYSLPPRHRFSLGLDRHFVGGRLHVTASLYGTFGGRGRVRNLLSSGEVGLEVGNLLNVESKGRAQEKGLYVHTSYRQSERLTVIVDYWLTERLNDTDALLLPPGNSTQIDKEWGPAANDSRHRLRATLASGLGDLRLKAHLAWQSALPFTVTTGRDEDLDGFLVERPLGVPRGSLRLGASFEVSGEIRWRHRLKGSLPASPAPVSVVRGGEARIVPTGSGGKEVGFFVRGRNLLNRLNPLSFVTVSSAPAFGRAVSARPPRQLEVGGYIRF